MQSRITLLRGTPLDMKNHKLYDGEILYDTMSNRCYMYMNGDYVDITNAVDPEVAKAERDEALTCKSCGARLQSVRCDYCGTFSWTAREFFIG